MSARFARESGQRFGVNGFVEESEAGGGQLAVALRVHFTHQHVITTFDQPGASLAAGVQRDRHDGSRSGDVEASGLVGLDQEHLDGG